MSKINDVEVITFKVDKSIKKLMQGIENRSEFIRTAILNALENICPFCKGTGVLTPHKKEHFDEFLTHHDLNECRDCGETVISCHKS